MRACAHRIWVTVLCAFTKRSGAAPEYGNPCLLALLFSSLLSGAIASPHMSDTVNADGKRLVTLSSSRLQPFLLPPLPPSPSLLSALPLQNALRDADHLQRELFLNGSDIGVPQSKELHGRGLSSITVSTFAELQSQLAGSTTTIRLAAGTYPVRTTLSIDRDVTMMADVEGSSVVLDGENARRVISISRGTVSLSGLSITNGYAYVGGGVYIWGNGTVVHIVSTNISENVAHDGGGICVGGGLHADVDDSTVNMHNCNIYNNRAWGFWGGGIAVLADGDGGGITVTHTEER